MAIEKRTKRIVVLGKPFDVDIDLASVVSSIVSTIIGVSALLFGIFQFEKGLDRTDRQIQFMEEEKIERTNENRPIIKVENFRVTNDEYDWKFSYQYVNVGKRQADSVTTITCLLSYDGAENLSESYVIPMYSSEVMRTGPVLNQDTLHYSKSFKRIDRDIYLAKIFIRYRDQISGIQYITPLYYKINLNSTPAEFTGYYDEQKHSTAEKHEEFHNIFKLYFPNVDQ